MSKLIDPAEHTGKTRAQRIRLNYHTYRGSIYRWRWIASACAIVIAACYLAWVGLAPAGQTHLSTGIISTVHASFEQNCSACHTDFVPIASDSWQIDPATAIKTTASKCRTCHHNVGEHAESLNNAGQLVDQRCALCHEEHVGRNRRLIPTSNQTCVACHENTSAFCASQQDAQPPGNVSQFSLANHGDFASLRSPIIQNADSPRIEFDHALHMNPGQVGPDRRGAMTLDRLPEAFVEKYQKPGQSMDAAVQLQCADCHEFQSSSLGLQRSGEFGWGRSSSPVSYNEHCVACHPLTVPGQREGQWAIPHGVAISSLRDSIAGQLASNEWAANKSGNFWKSDGFPIRVPGSAPDQQRGDQASSDRSADEGDRVGRTRLVISRLSHQCRVCHINVEVESITSIPPIPSPKLRAGRFDHGAHRSVTCIACHPQADPDGLTISGPERLALSSWLIQALNANQSAGTDDTTLGQAPDQLSNLGSANLKMILGIASCTPCHRDARQSEAISAANEAHAVLFGGLSDLATDRCTMCHDYHSSGLPQQKREPDVTIASESEVAVDGKYLSEVSLINTQAIPQSSPKKSRKASSFSGLTAAENRWLGSDSCGTSTCHSGPIGRQPQWNSSQSVFEAFDPHARAGQTLGNQLSKRIVWTLDPKSKDSPDRFLQVLRSRCNSCHSPIDAQGVMLSDAVSIASGQDADAGTESDPLQWLAGVSCEACHGPASGWVESHLREDWKVSDSMRETQDFVKRIDGCVRCHVGSRRADGLVRDMNHDMIAAGHPALRFDGWSALLRLPRHGPQNRSQDGLPHWDNESDLRRFLAAQAIGLRAAVQLTAERRLDADRRLVSELTSVDAPTASVWPELADFDCFACHHNLRITNFAVRPSSGHPLPHPWLLAGFIEHGMRYLGPSDVDAMNKALDTLRLRAAGINQVKPAVSKIEEIIVKYLSRLADPRPLPAEMKSLAGLQVRTVDQALGEGASNFSVAGDWYRASHWYLRSHVLIRDRQIQSDRREVAENLREMADALQFRRTHSRTGDSTVDSPEHFDMTLFRELSKRLSDSVESN